MYNVMVAPSPIPVFLDFNLSEDDLPIRPTEEEFQRICQKHEGFRIEVSKEGVIEIMPPTGGDTGRHNVFIGRKLDEWREAQDTGEAFDSSTMFELPNGAKRSPDASWVRHEIWEMLTPAERKAFPPLCPDFVIELRSPSDRLPPLKAKMQEYLDNGAQLGWLIDPEERKVYIYRPNQLVECLDRPSELSGENVLPGFVLPVARLWQD
jgi:Uma2 family endonuclease